MIKMDLKNKKTETQKINKSIFKIKNLLTLKIIRTAELINLKIKN